MNILAGNLEWTQGPYPASKYTNITIFNKVLHNFLELGKRVEADEGYRGHPDKIKCLGNDANPAENRAMQGRVRAHHETLNGWLKNWGILSQIFRHHIMMHGNVFRSPSRTVSRCSRWNTRTDSNKIMCIHFID